MPKNRSSWTILARDMVWKMYKLSVKESLDRKLKKLRKKDRELLLSIDKKVKEILKDPYRFKPLKNPCKTREECTWEDLLFCYMKSTRKNNLLHWSTLIIMIKFTCHDYKCLILNLVSRIITNQRKNPSRLAVQ